MGNTTISYVIVFTILHIEKEKEIKNVYNIPSIEYSLAKAGPY